MLARGPRGGEAARALKRRFEFSVPLIGYGQRGEEPYKIAMISVCLPNTLLPLCLAILFLSCTFFSLGEGGGGGQIKKNSLLSFFSSFHVSFLPFARSF